MIAKRRLLADLLYSSGLFGMVPLPVRQRLVVFNYHRILPDTRTPIAFDEGVYGPTASEFDAQLGWLARHCRVLNESELIECATTGRMPEGRLAAITFDDAYRDQFTIAWPLLRKHRLPAIFFVPTQLVSERRLGWWDLIAWLLKRTRRDRLEIDGVRYALPAERELACWQLQSRMKLEPATQTAKLVERLAAACEVSLPDLAAQDAELMTWDALRRIAGDGRSAIASHSHSHRVLATLERSEQEVELYASRLVVESEIGRPVRSLAYPVGSHAHFSDTTKELARRCGYQIAFSYKTGANPPGALDPFAIGRVATGSDDHELSLLAAAATLPEVFH